MSDSAGAVAGQPQSSQRHFIVLALFAAALIAVAAIYARDMWQTRVNADGARIFVADIDRWRKTPRERAVASPYDFSLAGDLDALPLQVGDWQGVDIPQNNIEVLILLEPEQYVYRRYRRDDGKFLWLSVIGSRQAKSFHPPQLCYRADGWRTEVASEPIPLQEGEIYALRLLAEKGKWTHVALYFYLYPDYLREADRGAVLFKVTAPLVGSLEETLALEKAFIREFFTRANL
ncbi:MAG: exosortase-associated EpsI family protein [Chloroflexi bacterium]|nr:exosortase-associated EpsI family protein [Chloroflexota bacterium]